MIYRLFVFLLLFTLTLQAEPSIAQIKAAVAQNPALLNTPQAQAAMAERGISAEELEQKLSGADGQNSDDTSKIEVEEAKNIIDDVQIKDTNTGESRVKLSSDKNPFKYMETADFRDRQQIIMQNKLSRYSEKFYMNKNQIDTSSLPTPENYIISATDVLSIQVYGDKNQNFFPEVMNDGTINLEYVGPIKIGGMEFGEAKKYLTKRLKSYYTLSEFNINMNKYSTIQVTLVGEVKHPGLYNVSSFSTVKDLLLEAKGVSNVGSVRDIVIKRDSKVVAHIDFYDLLFGGHTTEHNILKHGDIVIIQKAKKLVSIDGYINNAAIFELKEDETLKNLFDFAGGMKASASKADIKISRFSKNSLLETFGISYEDVKSFNMRDGDKVYIYPLDFSAQNSVNIYGNIIRPGSYRITGDATLNTLFKETLKHGIKKFFLPETNLEYGLIKRYSDDLHYVTESFNILNILEGSKILKIKPQDEIYIFSLNDIYANTYVTTMGDNLVRTGKLNHYKGMTLKDAINASGIIGILHDQVRVTTYSTDNFMPKTSFYSLEKQGDTKLHYYDEIEVFDYYSKNILEPVTINGEVVNPGSTFYETGMSAEDLIAYSGGFTKKAYNRELEIVRYYVDDTQTRQREIIKFDLEKMDLAQIKLMPYDEVKIFTIPKWGEKKSITIRGEVKFPGTYAIDNGEKLSSVLKRAGGFTHEAFIDAAVFTRESIKNNQIEQYNATLARIKRELSIFNAMPANSRAAMNVNSLSSLNEVMVEAKKYQPIGRVSVKLERDLDTFEQSPFNLVLQDKDTVTIPQIIDTVTVFGEVFNPSSFVHDSSLDMEAYIALASGLSRSADSDRIYVIHADGTSEPVENGWFSASSAIKKGDTIVVPMYIKEYNQIELWDSVSKIMSNFALTAAAINSLGITK
ncbi:SLBB domain-containing protein [bacterium]|nr:SLBB domain-containing protein [bacterium]MBU1990721.1 SLBB domain-containing protein [bacterium]